MCKVLLVNRSGYYAWCHHKPGNRELSNSNLDKEIKSLFEIHRSRYGAPRITKELEAQGRNYSKNRVAKRMKHLGLYAKGKKKFKVTTDSKHNLPVAENILNRNFTATAPNQKWVGDISYDVWTSEGWMHLSSNLKMLHRNVSINLG